MVERQFDSHTPTIKVRPRTAIIPERAISLRWAKACGLLVDREHAGPHDEAARLWYYYNHLFEVKTLLTFSTG